MLREVSIVRDSLFRGKISQFIGSTAVVWVALAVVSVLKDHSEAIRSLHENLDDACLEIGKARFSAGLATNVQIDWASGFVVRRIEEVPLLKRSGRVRLITFTVREVIDLTVSAIFQEKRLEIVDVLAYQWYRPCTQKQQPASVQVAHGPAAPIASSVKESHT